MRSTTFPTDGKSMAISSAKHSCGRDLLVRNSRLRGEELKIVVTGLVNGHAWHHYFVGTVKGDRIDGEVTVSDGNNRKVFPWTAARTGR